MTSQILDDTKPVEACSLLNRQTEITESSAWLSGVHSVALSMSVASSSLEAKGETSPTATLIPVSEK